MPGFSLAATGVFLFLATLPKGYAWEPGTIAPAATSGFSVDTANRRDVLAFYQCIYKASESFAANMAWTGSVASCVPGTTSAVFKNDVLRRVNFFRAMTGLPANITFNATNSSKAQEAALMMSSNGALDHFPPNTWSCYTANGYQAAGASNIALGNYGPSAVNAYMRDDGSNNIIVGHRRWILYSRAQEMGTGDIPSNGSYNAANALWVIGNFKPAPAPTFVAWPNQGYVPSSLVPARWSLSYPGADFGSAVVTMSQLGTNVPLTVISRSASGVGDSTIVWEPTGIPSSVTSDLPYTVSITNIGGGGPTSRAYNVILFNPDILGDAVSIAGTATPSTTGQGYTFNSIAQADSYELEVSTGSAAAWTEGAEDAPSPQIAEAISAGYALRQTELIRTGAKAFQLTFPSGSFNDQAFTVTRHILPSASSELRFYDRARFSVTSTTLHAQVSTDNGTNWTTLTSRNGVGLNSSLWDSNWISRNASLAPYAGQIVQIRFVMKRNGGSVTQGVGSNFGFFVDDVTVTNATQLVNANTTTLAGTATTFPLNATTAGSPLVDGTTYFMQIRPNVGCRWFGFGPLKTVTAQFVPVVFHSLAVAAAPAAGGSVSGGGTFATGSSQTITATAKPGYRFLNWTENGVVVSTNASLTFALSANRSFVANFQLVQSIAVAASPSAGGSVSGGGTYLNGTSRTITATANPGYRFLNWTENGVIVSTNASHTFPLSANRSFVANFQRVQTITLAASPSAGGSVSGGGIYSYGTSRTITAAANPGYRFLNWTENGVVVSTNASLTFALSANRSFVANFQRVQTITLAASPSTGGSVSGGGIYPNGTSRTITATANPGYGLLSWTENGVVVSTNASYTFALTANRSFVANFRKLFVVSVTPSSNGTVTSPVTSILSGGTVTFQATPAKGFTVKHWMVNGKIHQIGGTSLVLGNITTRSVVMAVFGIPSDDFNVDSKNDLVWQNQTTGQITRWSMANKSRLATGTFTPQPANATWQLVGRGDFNRDNFNDLVFQSKTTGDITLWYMKNGTRLVGGGLLNRQPGHANWRVVATGDFNNDAMTDLVLQNITTAETRIYLVNSKRQVIGVTNFSARLTNPDWRICGAGDVDRDGHADIIWQHLPTGQINIWLMNARLRLQSKALNIQPGSGNWRVSAVADFNADHKADLILQNTVTGKIMVWYLFGNLVAQGGLFNAQQTQPEWQVRNSRGW
jgi:uncharacterized protein YkwD